MYIRGYNIEKGVVLRGADLKFLNLAGMDLSDVDLTGSDLTRACLRGTDLTRAVLDDCTFNGVDLSWAIMDINTCCRSRFLGASLVGAKARNGNFTYCDFTDADLTTASFNASNLFRSNFTRTNLSSTSFRGSDLGGCVFYESVVHNTDMAGANIYQVYAPGFRFSRHTEANRDEVAIERSDSPPLVPIRNQGNYTHHGDMPHGVFPPHFGPRGANRP
jgi:uncharacterized protein YjbI with pentapeptide repeats